MPVSPFASACSAHARRPSVQSTTCFVARTFDDRRRQIADRDLAARREHRESLAQIFELAHVARPRVIAQRTERGRREALAGRARRRGRAREELLGHQRNILAPLAQRRQMQAHDVEPVQQIGAELAARDLRVEILMRRRDHARIGAHQLAPADAIELARREHAQQPRLQRQRHVADLVEKQRAAGGLLEASRRDAARRR